MVIGSDILPQRLLAPLLNPGLENRVLGPAKVLPLRPKPWSVLLITDQLNRSPCSFHLGNGSPGDGLRLHTHTSSQFPVSKNLQGKFPLFSGGVDNPLRDECFLRHFLSCGELAIQVGQVDGDEPLLGLDLTT